MQIADAHDFPLKFCSTRWTENSNILARAKKIVPQLRIYVQQVQKKPPDSNNYSIVKGFLKDVYLEAKLGFLVSISLELEKFLTSYQSNESLLPFLYHDLYALLTSLYSRIIKGDIVKQIKTAAQLLKIDLDNKENLCLPSNVDIGIISAKALTHIDKQKDSVDKHKDR